MMTAFKVAATAFMAVANYIHLKHGLVNVADAVFVWVVWTQL
jgi:hypothetical protein